MEEGFGCGAGWICGSEIAGCKNDLGALKELDAKLRVVQGMVYKGQIHTVATASGRATIAREAEASLLGSSVPGGKTGSRFPSNRAEVEDKELFHQLIPNQVIRICSL
jgi:hypothetical protein